MSELAGARKSRQHLTRQPREGGGQSQGAMASAWPPVPPCSVGCDRLTQLTLGSLVPCAADTQVPGDTVLAGAPVQAWLGPALIDFWGPGARVHVQERHRIKRVVIIRGNDLTPDGAGHELALF